MLPSLPSLEDVLSGATVDPHARVRMVARKHEYCHGPVRRFAGALWVSYNNEPVEVVPLGRDRDGIENYQERH